MASPNPMELCTNDPTKITNTAMANSMRGAFSIGQVKKLKFAKSALDPLWARHDTCYTWIAPVYGADSTLSPLATAWCLYTMDYRRTQSHLQY